MFSTRYKMPLLVIALAAASAAHASAPLISEGFDDISTLAGSGWVQTNLSTPAGSTSWFQGDLFAGQSGGDTSYIAANYNNAIDGGSIDNWLISPSFSTASAGVVTFWVKGAADPGYADTLKFGFSNGSSNVGSFTQGAAVTALGDWTKYDIAYAAGGSGSSARFAIEYAVGQNASDFVGVDSFSVTAVPEPATWLMFGIGLLGLTALRRRSAR